MFFFFNFLSNFNLNQLFSAKNGRRRVHQQERKRPVRYDDDYDEEEERPRLRKGNRKGSAEDDYRPRSRGSNNKGRKG